MVGHALAAEVRFEKYSWWLLATSFWSNQINIFRHHFFFDIKVVSFFFINWLQTSTICVLVAMMETASSIYSRIEWKRDAYFLCDQFATPCELEPDRWLQRIFESHRSTFDRQHDGNVLKQVAFPKCKPEWLNIKRKLF